MSHQQPGSLNDSASPSLPTSLTLPEQPSPPPPPRPLPLAAASRLAWLPLSAVCLSPRVRPLDRTISPCFSAHPDVRPAAPGADACGGGCHPRWGTPSHPGTDGACPCAGRPASLAGVTRCSRVLVSPGDRQAGHILLAPHLQATPLGAAFRSAQRRVPVALLFTHFREAGTFH